MSPLLSRPVFPFLLLLRCLPLTIRQVLDPKPPSRFVVAMDRPLDILGTIGSISVSEHCIYKSVCHTLVGWAQEPTSCI